MNSTPNGIDHAESNEITLIRDSWKLNANEGFITVGLMKGGYEGTGIFYYEEVEGIENLLSSVDEYAQKLINNNKIEFVCQ